MENLRKTVSIYMDNRDSNLVEEEKMIEEARTTYLDKIIAILNDVISLLNSLNNYKTSVEKLQWVISKLRSGHLYDYGISDNVQLESLMKENKEVNNLVLMLYNYSSQSRNVQDKILLKSKSNSHLHLKIKENIKFKKQITHNILNKNSYKVLVNNLNNNNSLSSDLKEEENEYKDILGEAPPRKESRNIKGGKNIMLTKLRSSNDDDFLEHRNKMSLDDMEQKIDTKNLKLSVTNDLNDNCKEVKKSFDSKQNINSSRKHKIIKKLQKIKIAKSCITSNNIQYELIDNGKLVMRGGQYIDDLDKIESNNFNIFDFVEEVGRNNAAGLVFKYILMKENLMININTNSLNAFVTEISNGYIKTLPYHNDLHAADVCQTLYSWIRKSCIDKILTLSQIDLLAVYTASFIHDFKHPGYNNIYQISFLTDIAITYNDYSVLENYHIAEAFKILQRNTCNILSKLNQEDYRLVRKRIIDAVLATDMASHSKTVSTIKAKVQSHGIINGNNMASFIQHPQDKQDAINYLIHSADLSHNTKEFSISYKWSILLHDEFFNQGDIEKLNNKPISFLCDRLTTNIEKGQIGFIKGIILPTFQHLFDMFPTTIYLLNNINDNLHNWQDIFDRKQIETK